MRGLQLPSCAAAMLAAVLSVVIFFMPAAGQVAEPEVVALSEWQPPGAPVGATYGTVEAVTLSPSGAVAFTSQQQAAAYLWRDGQVVRLLGVGDTITLSPSTTATVSGGVIPHAINQNGQVLLTCMLSGPTWDAIVMWDNGTITTLLHEGEPVPQLPGGTVGACFNRAYEHPTVLTLHGFSTRPTQVLHSSTTTTPARGLWRLGSGIADPLATCGNLPWTMYSSCNFATDINDSGAVVFTASGPAWQSWHTLNDVMTPILPVGHPAPGVPGAVITSSVAPLINDAGDVLALGGFGSSGYGVWIGPPSDMQLVAFQGQTLGGARESELLTSTGSGTSNTSVQSLGDDGSGYLFASVRSFPTVVRLRRGEPPAALRLSGMRGTPGNLFGALFACPTPGYGRFAVAAMGWEAP